MAAIEKLLFLRKAIKVAISIEREVETNQISPKLTLKADILNRILTGICRSTALISQGSEPQQAWINHGTLLDHSDQVLHYHNQQEPMERLGTVLCR